MTEEEKNERGTEEAAEEQAEAPAAEEPAEEAAEPAAVEEPAEEAAEPAAAEERAPSGEEALEGLEWKARRRLLRSRESGEGGPQRTPEERAAERAERRAKIARSRAAYRRKRRSPGQGGQGTPPAERRSAGRKVRQGIVVSDKPDKTITVRIDVARRHPAYEKIVRQSSTLHAHDERNEAGQGDLVRVVETRPLSRTKRWRLVEILERAK